GLTPEQLQASSLVDLLGGKLVTVDNAGKGTTKSVDDTAIKGKHVALYFNSKAVEDKLEEVAQGQGVITPTPRLKEVYAETKAAGKDFEMVYIPVAENEEGFSEHFKGMPWLGMKPDNATTMNLVRKYGVNVLPAVIVVDPEGEVVTTDGYSNMVYFPDDFPWPNKDLKQLLGDEFVKGDGTVVPASGLNGKVLGLYFGAAWCAPCKQFTPMLAQTYEAVKAAGKDFEVVFVSSDKEEEEFNGYIKDMPWLSVPYAGKLKSIIAQLLGIRGLPTLLLFDENNKLITANGRVEVAKDCMSEKPGENFPWYPKPLTGLTDAPESLAQKPTVIAFMEGVDAKEQEKIISVMQPIAEARMASSDAGEATPIAFLTATEIDQLSTSIRKLVGMEEIQGKFKFMKSKKGLLKPKMALLSLNEGKFAISTASDISADSVNALLGAYDKGTLEMQAFEVPNVDGEAEAE
ncbi:unnamed protein product, partial [Chrysoparadoxa australica]